MGILNSLGDGRSKLGVREEVKQPGDGRSKLEVGEEVKQPETKRLTLKYQAKIWKSSQKPGRWEIEVGSWGRGNSPKGTSVIEPGNTFPGEPELGKKNSPKQNA